MAMTRKVVTTQSYVTTRKVLHYVKHKLGAIKIVTNVIEKLLGNMIYEIDYCNIAPFLR
jgi:hypothetical protein